MIDTLRIGLLAADGPRARAYIQLLCREGLAPASVLLLPGDWQCERDLSTRDLAGAGFDPREPVRTTAVSFGIPVVSLPSPDVNARENIAVVATFEPTVIIFAGPAGQILRREILGAGKTFLHAHPGRLPEFRGSTTLYFSVLEERRCTVTALILNEGLDCGDVVLTREFALPRDVDVDTIFDPGIRARTIVDALRESKRVGRLRGVPQTLKTHPYYVVHPVLKHIALLGLGY